MAKTVKPIPDGCHSLNIYIALNDANKAIIFYKDAFGAKEKSRFDMPNGKVMFAELLIGDSTLQLSDEFPEHKSGLASPHSLKATSCIIHLYVEDVDLVFETAIKAGAKIKRPLDNVFWGDRYGQVEDPFGHVWSISTRIKNMTQDQLRESVSQLASQTGEII